MRGSPSKFPETCKAGEVHRDKEPLELHDANVTSMDANAPGVIGLRIVFVNEFGIIHSDGEWSLVDAGLGIAEARIRDWAMRTFSKPPGALVLTHGHFDHVG